MPELTVALTVEAAFDNQVEGLGEAGIALALGDERARAVEELEPLATEIADGARWDRFGVA